MRTAHKSVMTIVFVSLMLFTGRVSASQPPVASFVYSPTNPYVDELVTFDASSSYDPDGVIVNYVWDFGDEVSATGLMVTHSYTEPGNYTVTLTVVDNETASGTTSLTIEIMIMFPYELFIEIDYLEGHAPSQVVLAYIMNYFKEQEKEEERIAIALAPPEEINLADWSAIDPDGRITKTEFLQFEKRYNNLGDDKIIGGKRVYDSKWKWILYGNEHASDDVYGFTIAPREDMGNYIFIAETTCNQYATSHSAETTPDEVETMVLMHELGHTIGILKTYKGGSKLGEEKYDGRPHSVMNMIGKGGYRFNGVIDERYSDNYWKEKNLLPNYEY